MPPATDAADLVARARAWLSEDPDPETRAEVERLLAADDQAALAERFATRLEFGTAGLRGPLGAGPNRMNRAVVRRAAAGLAGYLHRQGNALDGVVIGFDARHKSDQFAADTASVMAGAGVPAFVLPGPLPTPLLAYAIRHLGTAAGVMVTASHNPPGDNGYKVYLGDGAQIIPPADREISEEMDVAGPLDNLTLAPPGDPLITAVGGEIVDRYLADASAQSFVPGARDLRIVYTPLHGVGGAVAMRLLTDAGFGPISVVRAQAEPDPLFPTVSFPNPEEPGTLDLAMAEASRVGADAVLANDPDADRLGVAVVGRDGSTWQPLRGDEIGVLLADHVLAHTSGPDRLVVTSIVSSDMLGRMAEAAGVHYARTLTGFKWVVRAAEAIPGARFVFGYEEALGYCAGTMVKDKDGMTAALLFAELAAGLKASGRTVHDRLDELAALHGVHLTGQWSVRLEGAEGLAHIDAAMAALRSAPPARLDGLPVTRVEDLAGGGGGGDGGGGGGRGGGGGGGQLPPSDVVVLHLGNRARITVRPSGTEPKLKVYFEVVERVSVERDAGGAGGVAAARAAASQVLAGLRQAIADVIGL